MLTLSELPASLQGHLPVASLPSIMASLDPQGSSEDADLLRSLDMAAAVAIIGSYGTIQQ